MGSTGKVRGCDEPPNTSGCDKAILSKPDRAGCGGDAWDFRKFKAEVTNETMESSMSFKSFAVEEFQDQSVARHRGQDHPGSVREQGSVGPDRDHGAAA